MIISVPCLHLLVMLSLEGVRSNTRRMGLHVRHDYSERQKIQTEQIDWEEAMFHVLLLWVCTVAVVENQNRNEMDH